jgi:hypothetical protein
MKKNVLFVVLFVGLIFSVFGQGFPSNPNFHQIDLLKYEEKFYNNGQENFQIGGFSKSGKVAYIINNAMDGRGGFITKFYIFDFINDKIIYNQTIDDYDYTYQGRSYIGYESYNDITRTSEYNSAYNLLFQDYIEKCRQNGIEFNTIEYRQLPIVYNNQSILINVEQRRNNIEGWGDDIHNIRYNVIASKLGKKKQITNGEVNLAGNVFPCGYFLSPFEDRALVVIGYTRFVFEGMETFFIFSGCHLSNGFN